MFVISSVKFIVRETKKIEIMFEHTFFECSTKLWLYKTTKQSFGFDIWFYYLISLYNTPTEKATNET